ncbi:MAG: hypothetical protein ACTHU0_35100, partial [Kofleriaceae bacterium]
FSLVAADLASSPAASIPVLAWDELGRVVVDDLPGASAARDDAWAQITTHLRALAPVEAERDGSVTVAIRCSSPNGEVVQPVKLELGDSPMGPWVVVRTVVPAQAALVERHALEHNASLAYGALCLEDGDFVLRHTGPLASFHLGDLGRLVAAMAHEAARLGARAPRTPSDISAFELYRD